MKINLYIILLYYCVVTTSTAATPSSLKVDLIQVKQWNNFVQQLEKLHKQQLYNRDVNIKKSAGGYLTHPDFYIEKQFFDKNSGLLLSRVQREKDNPRNIHLIEVFIYDKNRKLKYDYMAVYLPEHRNAPIQTLINFHYKGDELEAYRQFDASGARIYEQCTGRYFDNEILISLEEHEIPANDGILPEGIPDDLYLACFNHLPATAGEYINPGTLLSKKNFSPAIDFKTYEQLDKQVDKYSKRIIQEPGIPDNYIERGKLYFELHEFDKAVDDFNLAISIDKSRDEAWFWRGMANGRSGNLDKSIKDLSVYLKNNPSSSRGYTKRGVRYIWKGDLVKAEQDLKRAIQIDNNNAEAHDDLGVIFSQRGKVEQAIKHFRLTINIDPTYQKGWHNLAMAEYISANHQSALKNINEALKLNPRSKNSLMLKGEILMALGETDKAKRLLEDAEFLPEGNWSEQWPVR